MHDFFDKLGAAAKRAAGNVANEVSVAAEKQKLSEAYQALGKLCYQALKQDESLVCDEQIARIDEILKRLEELKDRRNVEPEVSVEPKVTVEPTVESPDFVIVEE
ncbi:MAG: hypothetical protein E7451_07215 [Ruminococcaceae bacterium]|nr:hypothetical protein [Oscillospiraceae bacterium]